MKCPECGAGGAELEYYSWIIEKWVVEFTCDEDVNHHFLIVKLYAPVILSGEDLETLGIEPPAEEVE